MRGGRGDLYMLLILFYQGHDLVLKLIQSLLLHNTQTIVPFLLVAFSFSVGPLKRQRLHHVIHR